MRPTWAPPRWYPASQRQVRSTANQEDPWLGGSRSPPVQLTGAGLCNAFSVTGSVYDTSRTSREEQRFVRVALAGCTRYCATLICAMRSRRKSPNCVFHRAPHNHLPRNSSDFVNLLHDCACLPAAPGKSHADSGSTLGKWLRVRFGDRLFSISARAVGVAAPRGAAEDTARHSGRVNSESDGILDFFHGLRQSGSFAVASDSVHR